jgi:hypothetical protein
MKEAKAAMPGPACSSTPSHLIPVEASDHGGRLRDIHKNGSGRSAILGSIKDPRKHDKARNHILETYPEEGARSQQCVQFREGPQPGFQ